jgi:hypothetical protein
MPPPYTGGCQCGAVRYVLTSDPVRVVACHCKECQRQSGSAFGMSMHVKEDSLTVTGPTKRFTRTADSGNQNTVCSARIAVFASTTSRHTRRGCWCSNPARSMT